MLNGYHINVWNITFALYQHKHLCFHSQATEDINPREQHAAWKSSTFRSDLNKSIHLSSLKNGNESSPWVYYDSFIISQLIAIYPNQRASGIGVEKVDLLVIHTYHLTLTWILQLTKSSSTVFLSRSWSPAWCIPIPNARVSFRLDSLIVPMISSI